MHSLLTYWHLDFPLLIFLICICLLYISMGGFKNNNKSVYFLTGLILIIFSIASPLHFLGENYLMSAHMLVHVILLLIAAPLLVLGIPENNRNNFLSRLSGKISKIPWLAWMTGVCIMWFWHIPIIFNHLFLTHDQRGEMNGGLNSVYILNDIHLISLIIAGIIFSLPVAGPNPRRRLLPLNAVLYLSAACIFCSILGLMITFAPAGIYTGYIHIDDRFGFLYMIRNQHGISALIDQQMAGLIMWVPGCLIYLSASMYLLLKWFKEKNTQPLIGLNKLNHE